jgi:hypothetical protein
MLVGGVLLFIDLFLPWQDFENIVSWNAWHGFGGWVLGLLTIVLLAWLVVRLMAVNIPLPISSAMTAALLAVLILFFAVIKNLVDDYSAWGSYVGIVLAVVIAVGAYMQIQEAGGIETLKSEIPSMGSSAATTAAEPPAAAAPPPPAPAEPAAPEPEAAPEEPPSERQT